MRPENFFGVFHGWLDRLAIDYECTIRINLHTNRVWNTHNVTHFSKVVMEKDKQESTLPERVIDTHTTVKSPTFSM